MYLKRYFMRNLTEAEYSADKMKFGWTIRQRKEDRREMAALSIALLHNVFVTRVAPRIILSQSATIRGCLINPE